MSFEIKVVMINSTRKVWNVDEEKEDTETAMEARETAIEVREPAMEVREPAMEVREPAMEAIETALKEIKDVMAEINPSRKMLHVVNLELTVFVRKNLETISNIDLPTARVFFALVDKVEINSAKLMIQLAKNNLSVKNFKILLVDLQKREQSIEYHRQALDLLKKWELIIDDVARALQNLIDCKNNAEQISLNCEFQKRFARTSHCHVEKETMVKKRLAIKRTMYKIGSIVRGANQTASASVKIEPAVQTAVETDKDTQEHRKPLKKRKLFET